MRRLLKILLVASLLALVPLRAMATVTDDACPQVHQAVHADAGHCHGGVAAVAAASLAIVPSAPGPVSIPERSAAAFVPEQPERPPLALR